MSFNPQTGLVYVPSTLLSSSTYTVNPSAFVFKEGGRNTGTGRGAAPPEPAAPGATPATPFVPPMVGPSDGQRGGVLIAWDPATQTERWRKEGGGAAGGGTVTTAGNLVLQVLPDGRLVVYSADKGEKLHEINTGLRIGMGPPVTYMVDGKQYVALIGGRGVVVPPPGAAGAGTAAAAPATAAGAQAGAPATGPGGAAAAEPPPIVPPKILTFALDGGAK
jgi:quinohemoprotein ethanol dehydrogenase